MTDYLAIEGTDPALAILAAAVAATRASAGVRLATGAATGDDVPVYSTAPAELTDEGLEGYPFIRIGEVDGEGDERLETDGVVDDPTDATLTIHVFDRGEDRDVRSRAIAGALRLALAKELELEGPFKITLGKHRATRHFAESDGLTAHSVLTFEYLIELEV